MSYFEQLVARSTFLRRALFGAAVRAGEDATVSIDRAPAWLAAGAETVQPSAPEPGADSAPAEGQKQNARENQAAAGAAATEEGIAEDLNRAAAAEGRSGMRAGQTEEIPPAAAPSGAVQTEETAWPESAAVQDTMTAAQASFAGEWLLERVRTAQRQSAQALPGTVQETASAPEYALRQETSAPEDWSARFERDARRYDGAYELM